MDIKQKYREEFNKEPYSKTKTGAYVKSGSYSDDYVKWLEKQLAISGVVVPKNTLCDCDKPNRYYCLKTGGDRCKKCKKLL